MVKYGKGGKGLGYGIGRRKNFNSYNQSNQFGSSPFASQGYSSYQPFGMNRFGSNFNSDEEEMQEEKKENQQIVDSKEGKPISKVKISLLKNPLNPFHLFKMERYDNTRKNNPMLTIMEVIELIAQEWGNVDDFTRSQYQTRYEEVLNEKNKKTEEIEEEKVETKPLFPLIRDSPLENKSTEKPTPPKRPLSAFFLYKQDVFDQVKKENPDAKITELTKIISQKWMNANSETKEKYEQKNEQAKQSFGIEMREYETKYGPIEKKKRKVISKGSGSDSNSD